MSNKECIIKICNISTILAFVFCDMYTIHVLIYVLLCICWRFFKVEKIKCMTIFGKCFLLIKLFWNQIPRNPFVWSMLLKKSWNVLLVLYLYKHSSYDNVSDLSNGAFLYIFFFNSQNPTFVIPNTLKYWRET